MTCEECEELLGAYVLDVATLEERATVEQHIARCPRCQQQLQEMRTATELLPLAAPQIDPPAYMKDRILSAIRESAPAGRQGSVRPFRPTPIQTSGPGVRAGQAPQPTPLPIRPAAQRVAATSSRRSRQWMMPLVAAAAVLFLLLSGSLTAWNISLQHQVTGLQATATNTVTLSTYSVKGTSAAPGATGQVLYLPQQHQTVIVMHGLPQLSGSQVYQGWLIRGKQTTSIGLLNVQSDGTATVNYNGDIRGFDAAAVSKEQGPTATPDAPKGPVVAVGPFSKA